MKNRKLTHGDHKNDDVRDDEGVPSDPQIRVDVAVCLVPIVRTTIDPHARKRRRRDQNSIVIAAGM